MQGGWSDKEACPILNLSSAQKAGQSLTPAVYQIALLWRANPTRTMLTILAEVERLNAEEFTDDEWERRYLAQTGKGKPCHLRQC